MKPCHGKSSSGTPILYLDFDGVLHHYDACIDERNRTILRGMGPLFEYAERLESALGPYPHVQIVLSTSWVRTKGLRWSCRQLPVGLRARVVGATWHSAFEQDAGFSHWWIHIASRYDQIARDVATRKPVAWFALDDDVIGWPAEVLDHVIACDPLHGLGQPATRLVLEEMLKRWAI